MRICPNCNRVFYLLRERHVVTCCHCGYNLFDKRLKEDERVTVNVGFTFIFDDIIRKGTITNYSSSGMGIVYRGEPLPVNTIIKFDVNELKIHGQAETVWTQNIGRTRVATGVRLLLNRPAA